MKLQNAASIEDMIEMARRRVPKFAFDFLDSGVGQDHGVAHNEDAFRKIRLKMVPLQGVSKPGMEVSLFGKTYSMPIGIAPMGVANIVWPGTDLILARLAKKARIPYTISTAASTSIEDLAAAAEDMTWFQLYTPKSNEFCTDLMGRCSAVGIDVLAITVDVPTGSRRNRNIRNAFTASQFRYSPAFIYQLLTHPAWALATLQVGPPRPRNYGLAPHQTGTTGSVVKMTALVDSQNKGDLNYDDLKRIRDQWKGKLLIKGVVDASAAKDLMAAGADGIWVSNHGGRQLESGLATIEALPAIRAAVGKDVPLVVDSGVRRGEDIIKAMALGADMVLSGRTFGYAAGAGAEEGVAKIHEILDDDLRRVLIQMGCPSIHALNPDWVMVPREGAND